ncbi:ATP-grasp domain-containing protein [Streptomyces lavendulae]|uniref:ATP-grasp domain-containing protein n=1 Tax=Streptomyces lavendulae TaxID=1914 RepID=UPI0036BA855E
MSRPTLLIVDGPGGPTPEWYLPRLCPHYDVHILRRPSGNPAADERRWRPVDSWCRSFFAREGGDLIDAIVAYAKLHDADGIVAFSEIPVVEAHTAADMLGLPGNPRESLAALRNKRAQRERLQAAGAPVPRFAEVRTLEEFEEALAQVGVPAVLKPVVGAGSMATYAVGSGTEVDALWREACRAYTADPRAAGLPRFILEQRLIGSQWYPDPRYGDYVSVESIVSHGEISHLAVTDKLPLSHPFRENGGMQPSVLPADRLAEIKKCATVAIEAIGITDSAVHTELKLTAEGPTVIEVNCRIGGSIAELLHLSAGYDYVQSIAAVATGRPLPPPPAPHRYAAYFIPQPPDRPVVLTKVPTTDEILAIPGVQDTLLPHAVGTLLSPERGSVNYLAWVTAAADRPQQLFDCLDLLNAPDLFAHRSPDRDGGSSGATPAHGGSTDDR